MVWLMIALAVGIIIGNLMLLKHTAHIKMPSLKDRQPRHSHQNTDQKTDQQKQDAWDDDWDDASGQDKPD